MLTCSHRPPCPGCPRFGEPGIAAAAHAALESLARAHGLPGIPVVSGATTGFRLRARLAIRGRLGAPKLGMFELGTHRVVHIPNCIVQHPLINRAAGVVRRALVDAGIAPYAESVHHGLARYLQVVVERSSGSAQLVIVGNSPTVEPLTACLELIRGRLGEELHSLWFNAQCERTNTILGREFRTTSTSRSASSNTCVSRCRLARASPSSMRVSVRSDFRCCRGSAASA